MRKSQLEDLMQNGSQDTVELLLALERQKIQELANLKEKIRLLELASGPYVKRKDLPESDRQLLSKYIVKNRPDEDPLFKSAINGLKEGWVRSSNPEAKKAELLRLAKSGAHKPKGAYNRLLQALRSYITPSSSTYDRAFTKKLKALRPDWFIKSSTIKKSRLLIMAKKGMPRPKRRSRMSPEATGLSSSFHSYTNPKLGTYDRTFTAQLKKIRPDWFK